MIYITGDTHSDFTRFNNRIFPEQKTMIKDDMVLICGDFGGIWDVTPGTRNENYWMDWLDDKGYTTGFIEGNHENHVRLRDYPVETWHGGKVHKIRPSVLHLMRGQVYTIDGIRIFTFGGARSHDISDGILDPRDRNFQEKRRRLDKKGAFYRVDGVTWWKEELPSEEEMEEGIRNLEKHNWEVDFILTHCLPTSLQQQIDTEDYKPDLLTDYLEQIREKCSYRYWFSGHYHRNLNLTEKDKVIYEQIIQIH